MQILEPIVHETVWGGTKLASFVETDCRKIGHLYGVIDTKKIEDVLEIPYGFVPGEDHSRMVP